MDALDLVRLRPLLAATAGDPRIRIGLVDGPVVTAHPALATESLREISGTGGADGARCSRPESEACGHGTFIAGILAARRGSGAPALCPGCTLLVRPLFPEGGTAAATPGRLAAAIHDCLDAEAHVLNLSVDLHQSGTARDAALEQALDRAVRRGVPVVAAAGNRGVLGGSALTGHPAVLPVVAGDRQGRPLAWSSLGLAAGRRGLCAPGEAVTSLGADGGLRTHGGSSAAAAFVTGALALLLSLVLEPSPVQARLAVLQASGRRRTVVPPLLDAHAAYTALIERRDSYGNR
jgi:subtilisin family serine protease